MYMKRGQLRAEKIIQSVCKDRLLANGRNEEETLELSGSCGQLTSVQ